MTILAEVVRNGVVESVHHGRLLVTDADGREVLAVGDVSAPVFPRSVNKPLQAVGLLRAGLEAGSEQIALASASHNGEPAQVAVVTDLLSGAGLSIDDLRCPPDWPLYEPARDAVIRSRVPKSPVFMNCSGKHAAMLATAVARSEPTASYLSPAHPVQRAIAETLSDLAGTVVGPVGVDGCGAPLLGLTPRGLARAFTRLATATSGAESEVAGALRSHPSSVAGTGRALTALLAGVTGLVGKDGAEGVWAVAVPGAGAVVVKIDDGAGRATVPVVVAGLRLLGVTASVLDDLATTPVLGGGRPVGEIRASSQLTQAH